jgi:putative aldouronate transport system substrate-binding protein
MNSGKIKLAVFCLFTTTGMLFAGGGGQTTGGSTSSGGKESLTIGIQTNPFITSYKDNYFTRYLENLHNIDLNFYELPTSTDEVRTKLSLMISSNDLPDTIFVYNALTEEAILDYGSKGAFIPLNKYITDPVKAPNFAAIPEEDRTLMLRAMTSVDGNMYALATFVPGGPWDLSPYRLYLNRAWVRKLGLKLPTTTDELRNVLIAFRDGDPNGNGRKDEIGVYGFYSGTYGQNIIAALLNSFIFYNPNQLSLDESGNRVIAPFTDPAFRKGLVYLNGLYKDGLLAASLFTDDVQQFRAVLNNDPPIAGLTSAGSTSNWADIMNNANYLEMAPMVPPFTGPDGIAYTPYTEYTPDLSTFITSKAKNPDLVFKFVESFYNEDVGLINRFGEEDVDWTRKPEALANATNAYVELGLYPATSLALVGGKYIDSAGNLVSSSVDIWASPNNKFWHDAGPRYMSANDGLGIPKGDYDNNPHPAVTHNAVHFQYYNGKHPKYVLPRLKYNAEDSASNADAITLVNEYVKQSIAEFVTGARDINNNTVWNAYLRELDNMDLQRWITSTQRTWDRQR